jgi:phosphoheptose isomerase
MQNDPRHRNTTFDDRSVGAYLDDYRAALAAALGTVDKSELERALKAVALATTEGKRIHAIGNGGSASIADHLCCDWTKGTHHHGHPTVRAYSLNANVALYSAIANDYGFEKVFSTQVQFYGEAGDVLIAISSSGNSPNILAAVETAQRLGMTVIGVSGFNGGALRDRADIALYVAADNYGIVEDGHQALMHVLAQYIAKKRDQA